MQLFYVIVAFLACTVAPSAADRERCDQLPTTLSHDARLAVQPQGKGWMLYKSNAPQQRCLNMSYEGNHAARHLHYVGFEFIPPFKIDQFCSQDNFHISMKVDVNPEMNSWIVTDDTGVGNMYRKLCLDDISHWWCGYTCDDKKEYIKSVFCGVIDDKGKDELDAFLAKNFPDKDLPLRDGQTLVVVYDKNCKTKSS